MSPHDPPTATNEHRLDADRERYDRHYVDRWSGQDLVVAEHHEQRRSDLRRATLYALDQMGDLHGLRVLELGAGNGTDSVVLARRGAEVLATDISESSCELLRRRFEANHLPNARVANMPAEALDVPDASFDRVFARGVLHHADVTRAAPEIARALRPGGRAVFIEPLSENPLLDFAREHLPYPGKTRPRGHRGIRYATVRVLRDEFRTTTIRGFYLTSMLNRAFGFNTELVALERFDDWLLGRSRTLRRLCRYAVVVCHR